MGTLQEGGANPALVPQSIPAAHPTLSSGHSPQKITELPNPRMGWVGKDLEDHQFPAMGRDSKEEGLWEGASNGALQGEIGLTTRFGFVWLNSLVLIQALHEKYAKQNGQTRFRAQEQENSLACPEAGKGRVYLLQTTGSSKIGNGQLTSICQWFPGRNNCAPPPLPATRVSRTAQGTFQESK